MLFGAGSTSGHRFLAWEFVSAESRPDMRAVDVEMKLHFWNANYVGTHFGGSLFAMTDPFYMLMAMANLGARLYRLGQSRDHPLQETGERNCARAVSSFR